MNRATWIVYFVPILINLTLAMPGQADALLNSIALGLWGGEHIRMIVTAGGAKIEYDCARGIIDESLAVDKDGNFEALGIHVFEPGGPAGLGEPPPEQHPALYRGWTDGSQMRLTVSLLDTGKTVGIFTLGLGRSPSMDKCL